MNEQVRIESHDYSGNLISTAIIHYEYHCDGKKTYEDGATYWDEYVVLQAVEIEVTPYGEVTIECELTDKVISHFSDLLTKRTGLEVKELVA